MKINRLLIPGFILAGLLVYVSCRKIDRETAQVQNVSSGSEARFFDSHRSADPQEQAIVNFIKKRNDKDHFVDKVITQIGFPYWDKAMKKAAKPKAHGREANDSAIVIYVPFVRDSQNYVNASLVIHIEPADTSFSYLCDWQYSQMQNDPASISDSAEYFAIFFMALDKSVFGHNKFQITDSSLFKNGNKRAYYVSIPGDAGIGAHTNLMSPIEVCQTGTIYFFEECPYPHSDACINGCDHCFWCLTPHPYEYCWDEYVDDGSGGGGPSGPGDGGGGGDGGGSTPPPCPGGPVARTNHVTDPCTPGWNPDPGGGSSPEPDPCAKVASLKTDLGFKGAVNLLRSKLTENKEYAYLHKSDGSWPTGIIAGTPGECEVKVTITTAMANLKNYLHIHNNTCPLPIFGPDDLKNMADFFIMNKYLFSDPKLLDPLFSFGLVTDNAVYLMVIDDPASFEAFYNNYFSETSPRDLNDLTKNYRTYDIKRTNSAATNEEQFLKFLKKEGVGVKLLKADNDLSGYNMLMLNRNNALAPPVPCN